MVKLVAISCCKARSRITSTTCTSYRCWADYTDLRSQLRFFISVRNHGGVPDIDEDLFRLEIGGLVKNSVSLSLKDLKDPEKFPYVLSDVPIISVGWLTVVIFLKSQSDVTVTLQCSGTRRIEQIREYPGDGDELINAPWGEGAMYVINNTGNQSC